MNSENKKYRCIWCMKDSITIICEHCGSDQVYIKDGPHNHHWSRETLATVKCKICDKIEWMEDYFAGKVKDK